MRNLLKRTVERALLASGVSAVLGRAARRFGLILAFHNIVPHGERSGADRSLHLAQRDFGAQLDLLQRETEVVSLTDIMRASPEGRRPRVAITFDDAYRGTVTAGVAELQARGIPATIFVVPSFVGWRPFWWDVVAEADAGPGLSTAAREHALEACAGRDALVREWAATTGLLLLQPPAYSVAASEEELLRALEHPGMTLGSHTWSHPNLTRLNDLELEAELSRPLGWLQERFPRVIPWLTYPYGRSDVRVERAAARAGYAAALRVDGGWLGHTTGLYSVPRLNIPSGTSLAGFRLRLDGLFCG